MQISGLILIMLILTGCNADRSELTFEPTETIIENTDHTIISDGLVGDMDAKDDALLDDQEVPEKKIQEEEFPTSFPIVRELVFRDKCMKCHNNSRAKGGINLEDYDKMMEFRDNLIDEINIDDSPLLQIVSGVEPEMPPSKEGLTVEEILILRKWITAGTPRDLQTGK